MPVVVICSGIGHGRGANGITEVGIFELEINFCQHGVQNSREVGDFVNAGLAKICHLAPRVDVGAKGTRRGEWFQGDEVFRRNHNSCLRI